jgi:hypothetical protein
MTIGRQVLAGNHSPKVREKSSQVEVLVSQWWISCAVKTVGQSEAKINTGVLLSKVEFA